MTLSFAAARAAVLREVTARPERETLALAECTGRVLAHDLLADRDFPALDRSVRDGYAVRAQDLPGPIPIIGVTRAGDAPATLKPGSAIEIMTGAPIPAGADAVLMIEQVQLSGQSITHAAVAPGTHISRRAEEAVQGQLLLSAGTRLDPSHIAVLAACGHAAVAVFHKPTVAILATGDELVAIDTTPLPHQIRNSNAYALAAQVLRAGGVPRLVPVAPDDRDKTRALIEEGLADDLLLLSGGVSAGKFDFVENALADLGATFHFDRAAIQPGAPIVFGHCRQRPFFGLPGNPVSTLVTFEIFARAALNLLAGADETALPIAYGRLTEPFRHRPGLTRFLPAYVDAQGGLTPVRWRGSSDMAAVARANAFLIADAEREDWDTGDFLPLLWK